MVEVTVTVVDSEDGEVEIPVILRSLPQVYTGAPGTQEQRSLWICQSAYLGQKIMGEFSIANTSLSCPSPGYLQTVRPEVRTPHGTFHRPPVTFWTPCPPTAHFYDHAITKSGSMTIEHLTPFLELVDFDPSAVGLSGKGTITRQYVATAQPAVKWKITRIS